MRRVKNFANYFVVPLLVLLFGFATNASKAKPISFPELVKISDHVAIGTVVQTVERSKAAHTGNQEVTVKLESSLKGSGLPDQFKIALQYKGLVEFDPKLSKGDKAIFFLKDNGTTFELASFGAVAVFAKKENFLSSKAIPADVRTFIESREKCDHLRGEEPYDKARAEELKKELEKNCDGSDKELASLRAKYAKEPKVLKLLKNFEDRIE